MGKIRILQVLSDSNIGGAGRLLYNLSKSINSEKFEFIYVFPKGSELCELFNEEKKYILSHGSDRSSDIRAALEIRRIIKSSQPHIIHTHSSLFARIGAKLAGFDKKRVIYTKHCVFDTPKITESKIFRHAYRIIDNFLSDNIIAVADAAKDELIAYGVNEDKITVIINGVNPLLETTEEEKQTLREKLGIKKNNFTVGISARLEEYKGHKTLIKAAEITKKQGIDDIAFLILGDGSYAEEFKNYAESLGVSDRIFFLGFKKNVAEYVNLFDVNVNCSIGTETSSLAISEGLSLGKPIIATDFGGNPNMVKEGETGFIIPQNDARSLTDKIIFLKDNPDILKYMSKNAKLDFGERFSAKIMADKYENYYISILRKKG